MTRKTLHVLASLATIAFLAGCQADDTDDLELGQPGEAAPEQLDVPAPTETGGTEVATLRIDTHEGGGEYITDGQGRALYLFTADSEGESTCYDACAEMWPPFLASAGNPAAGAPELNPDMLGTVERRDGTLQVTYNGHPLYHYARDTGPGEATGQDVHDSEGEWYLVTPEGTELEAREEGGAEGGGEGS